MTSRVRGWVVAAVLLAGLAGVGWQVLAARNALAPAITLSTLQGRSFTLDQWKGKVVLVNFWATSCSGCVKEMPELVKTFKTYQAQGFETVAVAMSYDPPAYVESFTRSRELPFTVALDRDGHVAKAFGEIRLTPTTFVLDKQGRIVQRYIGVPDFAQLHQLIEAKLKERT